MIAAMAASVTTMRLVSHPLKRIIGRLPSMYTSALPATAVYVLASRLLKSPSRSEARPDDDTRIIEEMA